MKFYNGFMFTRFKLTVEIHNHIVTAEQSSHMWWLFCSDVMMESPCCESLCSSDYVFYKWV